MAILRSEFWCQKFLPSLSGLPVGSSTVAELKTAAVDSLGLGLSRKKTGGDSIVAWSWMNLSFLPTDISCECILHGEQYLTNIAEAIIRGTEGILSFSVALFTFKMDSFIAAISLFHYFLKFISPKVYIINIHYSFPHKKVDLLLNTIFFNIKKHNIRSIMKKKIDPLHISCNSWKYAKKQTNKQMPSRYVCSCKKYSLFKEMLNIMCCDSCYGNNSFSPRIAKQLVRKTYGKC